MARFDKWLGASIGWIATSHPLGALVGMGVAGLISNEKTTYTHTANTTDFETSLLVLAAAVINVSNSTGIAEEQYIQSFFQQHITSSHWSEKRDILTHCMSHPYDMQKACTTIRVAGHQRTREQALQFLMEVAVSDNPLSEAENKLLFRLAGWLNINDVVYRHIRQSYILTIPTYYLILGVHKQSTIAEIKAAYRRLVKELHPDRYPEYSVHERRLQEDKFRKMQQAYDKIKEERGFE